MASDAGADEDVLLTDDMMGLLIGVVDEAENYSVLSARFPEQPLIVVVVIAASAERVMVACPRGSIEQGVPDAPTGAPAAAVFNGEDGSTTKGELFAIDGRLIGSQAFVLLRSAWISLPPGAPTEHGFGLSARALFKKLGAWDFCPRCRGRA